MDDVLDILINIPILTELNSDELRIVGRFFDQVKLPKGQILFSEGDAGDALYYILSGRLIIYKDCGDAMPVEITRVNAGQFLGELAILEDSFRSATVQAAVDTDLLLIQKTHFYDLLERYPKIGVVLLRGLARMISLQLRNTTGQLAIQHTG